MARAQKRMTPFCGVRFCTRCKHVHDQTNEPCYQGETASPTNHIHTHAQDEKGSHPDDLQRKPRGLLVQNKSVLGAPFHCVNHRISCYYRCCLHPRRNIEAALASLKKPSHPTPDRARRARIKELVARISAIDAELKTRRLRKHHYRFKS